MRVIRQHAGGLDNTERVNARLTAARQNAGYRFIHSSYVCVCVNLIIFLNYSAAWPSAGIAR